MTSLPRQSDSYRAWDQEDKLGPPPWSKRDPRVKAWEIAHDHDVRLKCYEEFGCRFAEVEITDEMVAAATEAGARWFTEHPDGASSDDEWRDHYRAVLEAATGNLR